MFETYVKKNKHLSPQAFALADEGLSIRQIALKLGISWDRVNYMLVNRNKLNTV